MARVVLPLYTPRYIPNGNEIAVITTSKGVIEVALDGLNAPVTVGNFIELSKRGFYNNLKFHAHRADSAVLGGCPITRNLGPAQVDAATRGILHGIHPGRGDASYTIIDEYKNNPNNHHKLGSIVFAHKSEPNSGSCQFYFSLAEQPQYDDQYTVFGETIKGLDVVKQLWVGDAIEKIEILNADEDALAEAVSHEPPRPEKTPTDVFVQLKKEQAAAFEEASGAATASEES